MSTPMEEQTGLRKAMAWIHTWLGLLAGWILFAMFLTGTASYFRPEITRWMQPELRLPYVAPPRAAETAVAYLQKVGANDDQWTVYLPDDRTTATRIFRRLPPSPEGKQRFVPETRINPETGDTLAARETRGGEHFYRFHFQLQIPHPWGRWLAGLCTIFMLSAIISGVITHKRIFADFFTLRWSKGKRSWLDAHNVCAVLALPYHAMITYTGLITLMVMYMPWPIDVNYKSSDVFYEEAYGRESQGPASGISAPLVPIAPLIETAMREWGGGRASRLVILHPNDQSATITVIRHGGDTLNAHGQSVIFSGSTGERLSASAPPGPAVETAGVMLGLHMGWFADLAMRWVFLLLGLVGTCMVGTGLVMWTVKRAKPGMPFFGYRLVERLNIGAIACLPAGMAAFLLANRLIPAGVPARGALEVEVFYWVWFGLAAVSVVRPVRRAWMETLAIGAMAFAAVPIVNTITTNRGLAASLTSGDGLFVAFDITMIAAAALLAFAAWKCRKPAKAMRPSDTVSFAPQTRELTDAA